VENFCLANRSLTGHGHGFTKFSAHVTRGCGSVSSDNNAMCYVLLVLWMMSLCLPIHSKWQAIMFYSCDLLFFAV